VARTPPERTLDWVLGVIGSGARIVETRTLHGDEPPWQLRIEHRVARHMPCCGYRLRRGSTPLSQPASAGKRWDRNGLCHSVCT
jgi:hypothetical protein